jgi:hypothetical protein
MDMRDLTKSGRAQADPLKCELILQIGRVGESASEPVDCLTDDYIELTFAGVPDQLLEAGPEAARAANRSVPIGPDGCPALGLDVTAADLDLVLDRGLPLQVG